MVKSYCNVCKIYYDESIMIDGSIRHNGLCRDEKNYILSDIAIDMVDLAEFKTQPYKEFIESVMDMSEMLHTPLTMDYFNQQIKEVSINIPTHILDGEYVYIHPLFTDLTYGKLLYQFSQYLSDYEGTEELFGNHYNFDGFILTENGSYNINCG